MQVPNRILFDPYGKCEREGAAMELAHDQYRTPAPAAFREPFAPLRPPNGAGGMTALLPPEVRTKLVGILGLLSSPFDGERASAALLASRLVKKSGLTWDDLFRVEVEPPQTQRATATWQDDATLALHRRHLLTPWEYKFLTDVITRPSLSPKQRTVLTRIIAKTKS